MTDLIRNFGERLKQQAAVEKHTEALKRPQKRRFSPDKMSLSHMGAGFKQTQIEVVYLDLFA